MAKTPSNQESLKVKAIQEYAKVCPGKIKASELAEWASQHIPGLENVKAYHFTRPETQKDPKTGETIQIMRESRKYLEEVNQTREIKRQVERNLLLHSSDAEAFLRAARHDQLNAILEARKYMDQLIKENVSLRKKNEQLESRNAELQSSGEEQGERLQALETEAQRFSKAVLRLMRSQDEKERKAVLKSIGLTDGDIDFDKYYESLSVRIGKELSINKTIRGVIDEDEENEPFDPTSLLDF